MRFIFAVLCLCIVLVQGQMRPPRPPPSGGVQGTPVPMPASDIPVQTSPPRPKGCSPGCGPTEICAELGSSYCKSGQVCSVCIKMSSIRFPASALAGMFASQAPRAPEPQAQPVVPSLPMSNAGANPLPSGQNDKEIPILEYAAQHRQSLNKDEISVVAQTGNIKPPRPPTAGEITGYDVVTGQIEGPLQEGMVTEMSGTTPSMVDRNKLDIENLQSHTVKYPIIVQAPGSSTPAKSTAKESSSLADAPTTEDHFGHIDQTQMEKWYQRYLQFRAQQDSLSPQTSTGASTDTFDYGSFQQFQDWLLQNDKNVHTKPATQPSVTQTPLVVPSMKQPVVTLPQTLPRQQNMVPALTNLQTNSLLPTNTVPTAPTSQSSFTYADIQQQFQQWQLQQQLQQAQQVPAPNNMFAMHQSLANTGQTPHLNMFTFPNDVPAQTPQQNLALSQNNQQQNIDFATMQQQYQLWLLQQQQQQNQLQTGAPDLQQQYLTWLQQQQTKQSQETQGQGQTPIPPNGQAVQEVNIEQLPADQQGIETNPTQITQNIPQQENTVSYLPQQQTTNTFNNDPFNFFDFNPMPQQNTLFGGMNPFGLMMFDGLGFGGFGF